MHRLPNADGAKKFANQKSQKDAAENQENDGTICREDDDDDGGGGGGDGGSGGGRREKKSEQGGVMIEELVLKMEEAEKNEESHVFGLLIIIFGLQRRQHYHHLLLKHHLLSFQRHRLLHLLFQCRLLSSLSVSYFFRRFFHAFNAFVIRISKRLLVHCIRTLERAVDCILCSEESSSSSSSTTMRQPTLMEFSQLKLDRSNVTVRFP